MKLREYIQGDRRGREAQRIEREAMRDPLLHDALEGYDRVPGGHDEALERLRARIAQRAGEASPAKARRHSLRRWSIAAAAVVLLGLTTGALLIVLKDPMRQPIVAQDTQAVKETPPEVARQAEAQLEPELEKTEAKTLSEPRKVEEQNLSVAADMELSESKIVAEEEAPAAEMQLSEAPVPAAQADTKIQLSASAWGESPGEDQRIIIRGIGTADIGKAAAKERKTEETITLPEAQALEENVALAFGSSKKNRASAGTNEIAPADTTTTPEFRRYLSGELTRLAATEAGAPEGSATLEFEVNEQGRPTRITDVESTSIKALREARRILQGSPDWPLTEGKHRITILFQPE